MGSSADEAMIDLLAGLENDGYQMGHQKTLSHHRSLGSWQNSQNSDDEENEPQCEKEEMELSLLMSQRWDSSVEEPGQKRRYIFSFLNMFYFCQIFPFSYLVFKCAVSPMRCGEVSVNSMEKSVQILGWNARCLDDDVPYQCYLEIKIKCLSLAKHKLLVCSLRKN